MQTQQGNAWQNELQAQVSFGRSQSIEDEMGVSPRPFGQQGGYSNNYNRPRQHNGARQFGDRQQSQGYVGQGQTSELAPTLPRHTGHMAFLKSLQQSSATVRLVTIHDDVVIGQLKNCDDTTISIRVDCPTETNPNAYQNRVFFKQNLVEFAPVVEGVTFS